MKKYLAVLVLILLSFGNTVTNSKENNTNLNQLFKQLKKCDNSTTAAEIEMKIWKIWYTHPTEKKLTQLLEKGSDLISKGELEMAHKIFSTIINSAPNWAEGWNKRATVLYLMGRYQDSLNDIDEVLKLENRHFGALSGRGLVQIKLGNYEKAIESYQDAQKIYPSIDSAKVMIPRIKKLIKDSAI